MRCIQNRLATRLESGQATCAQAIIRVALVFCCVGNAAQSGDFAYEASGSGIEISAYTGSGGSVAIPATMDGVPVTSIANRAFAGSTSVTRIDLPTSVTSIGEQAFRGCTGLTSLTVPNTVTRIGGYAFYGCSGLVDLTVDTAAIRGDTFAGLANLKTVTLGNSMTTIPDGSFEYCAGLTNVTVGNRVTAIGSYAFHGCTGLTSIKLPRSLTGIWNLTFYGCTELTRVYFAGNAPKDVGIEVFGQARRAIVYHLAGTKGWGAFLGGHPTAIWRPAFGEWADAWGLPLEYPHARGEEDDADQDGLTNGQELTAGTDPTDPKSVLVFELLVRPVNLIEDDRTVLDPSEFAFYFQSSPGVRYDIQSTDVQGGAWTTLTSVTATTTQKRVRLHRPATPSLYRIVIP